MKASMNDVWGPITAEIHDADFEDPGPNVGRVHAIRFRQDKSEFTVYVHGHHVMLDLINDLYAKSEALPFVSEKQA